MTKTGTKSKCCRVSVTSVTKRNKRNLLRLDSKRNNVTSPPCKGGMYVTPAPGLFKMNSGLCPTSWRLPRQLNNSLGIPNSSGPRFCNPSMATPADRSDPKNWRSPGCEKQPADEN